MITNTDDGSNQWSHEVAGDSRQAIDALDAFWHCVRHKQRLDMSIVACNNLTTFLYTYSRLIRIIHHTATSSHFLPRIARCGNVPIWGPVGHARSRVNWGHRQYGDAV